MHGNHDVTIAEDETKISTFESVEVDELDFYQYLCSTLGWDSYEIDAVVAAELEPTDADNPKDRRHLTDYINDQYHVLNPIS